MGWSEVLGITSCHDMAINSWIGSTKLSRDLTTASAMARRRGYSHRRNLLVDYQFGKNGLYSDIEGRCIDLNLRQSSGATENHVRYE